MTDHKESVNLVNTVVTHFGILKEGKLEIKHSSLTFYFDYEDLKAALVNAVRDLEILKSEEFVYLVPMTSREHPDGGRGLSATPLEESFISSQSDKETSTDENESRRDRVVPNLILVMLTKEETDVVEQSTELGIDLTSINLSEDNVNKSFKFIGFLSEQVAHSNKFSERYAYISESSGRLLCTDQEVTLTGRDELVGPKVDEIVHAAEWESEKIEYDNYEYRSCNARIFLKADRFYIEDAAENSLQMIFESTPIFPLIPDIMHESYRIWTVERDGKTHSEYWLGRHGFIWKVVDGQVVGFVKSVQADKIEDAMHYKIPGETKDDPPKEQRSRVLTSDPRGNLYILGGLRFAKMTRRLNFSTDEYPEVKLITKGANILVCRGKKDGPFGVVGRLNYDPIIHLDSTQ